jgi:trehalose 6-phosphate phosphatase
LESTTDSTPRPAELLAPLAAAPGETAILTDVDGTLAPIVPEPHLAQVPAVTTVTLAALAERYALVGCISGRRAAEVRDMVRVDRLHYVGIHGFERLEPGATAPTPDPRLQGHLDDARAFVERFGPERIRADGLRIEDKGAIQALHWRGAQDEDAARALAEAIGAEAQARGLVSHVGRKVLEIRPQVAIDKGTALTSLVEENRIECCLFAGDDHTDLDAFAALTDLRRAGKLRAAVRVGIAADESPPAIAEQADIVVATPAELLPVLQQLML